MFSLEGMSSSRESSSASGVRESYDAAAHAAWAGVRTKIWTGMVLGRC
jgi:hypothetical protein